MKKLLVLLIALMMSLTLSGCDALLGDSSEVPLSDCIVTNQLTLEQWEFRSISYTGDVEWYSGYFRVEENDKYFRFDKIHHSLVCEEK